MVRVAMNTAEARDVESRRVPKKAQLTLNIPRLQPIYCEYRGLSSSPMKGARTVYRRDSREDKSDQIHQAEYTEARV